MSKWIQHVKDYSEQNNMKYNEALSDPVCRALGHSLGGLVAEEVGKNSKNVITYNKAISPFEMLKKNQSNQTDIKTSNDPVSSLNYFNNNKKNKTKVFNAKTNNPFKSHSTDALKHLNADKVIGE